MNDKHGRTWLFGIGARGLALGSQLLLLLVLARLLEKEDFGNLMVAFAFHRILSFGLGTAAGSILLYRISRTPIDDFEIPFSRLVHLCLAISAGLVATLIVIAAVPGAQLVGKPELAKWLISLAPLLVTQSLLTSLSGAYDARGRIERSIAITEVAPNVLRLLLLPILMIPGEPAVLVGIALGLGSGLPCIAAAWRLRKPSHLRPIVTAWDLRYGLKLGFQGLLSLQVQGIDLVVASALFSSADVADYALASRFATLFPFLQQLVTRRFSPKVAMLIDRGDTWELDRLTAAAKVDGILAVGLCIATVTAGIPFLLAYLPEFEHARILILLLAVPSIVRSYYTGGDALLRASGQADASLLIMALSFSVVVAAPLLLSGTLGIGSIPVAMWISAISLNPVMEWLIRRSLRLRLFSSGDLLLLPLQLAPVAALVLLEPTGLVVVANVVLFVGASILPRWLHSLRSVKASRAGQS